MVKTDQILSNVINEGCAVSVEQSEVYVFGGLKKSEPSGDAASSSSDADVLPSTALFAGNLGKEAVLPLAPLLPGRVFSTLTRLGSKLYLTFGFHPDTGWSEDVFAYDIKANLWSTVEIDEEDDEIPGPRDKHCAVAVDKEIYVFGGFGPMEDDEEDEEEEEEEEEGEGLEAIVEETTEDNATAEKTETSKTGASGDKEEEEKNESLGPSASFSWFNEMWIFTVNSESGLGNWRQPIFTSSARPTPRAASSLCLDPLRNRLINFGGRDFTGRRNDVNIFDLSERKWCLDVAEGGTVPSERSFHAACVHNDRLIVCGGRDSKDVVLGDVFLLDLDSLLFERVSVSVSPRCCHLVSVWDERMFVVGGVDGYEPETMLCLNAVDDVTALPWADLISQETEPSPKKRRLSDSTPDTTSQT